MNKKYLSVTGLVASFAIGFYLNTVLANKSTNQNSEIIKTEKKTI